MQKLNKRYIILLKGSEKTMAKFKILESGGTKLYIAQKGYSLKDFSTELGISPAYLSLVLNGKKSPSPGLAKRISEKIDRNILDVFYLE
ncbi:MAG: helix-turn-helix transcriptional regulator [Carnobacterium sp.]